MEAIWPFKLNILFSDSEKAKKMGEMGKKFIEENFSWDKIAKKFIKIVEKKIN